MSLFIKIKRTCFFVLKAQWNGRPPEGKIRREGEKRVLGAQKNSLILASVTITSGNPPVIMKKNNPDIPAFRPEPVGRADLDRRISKHVSDQSEELCVLP